MSEAAADEAKQQLVLKTRLKHLLTDKGKLRRLQDGVLRMHAIVASAYELGKLRYLDALERELAVAGGAFSPAIAASLAAQFPVTKPVTYEAWLDAVSSVVATRLGPALGAERKAHMLELEAFYDAQAALGHLPVTRTPATNLSFAKGYAATQMATAYKNNVVRHADAYVRRFVTASLLAAAQQAAGDQALTPTQARQVKAEAGVVTQDILTARQPPKCAPERHAWVAQHAALLVPPRPQGKEYSDDSWRFAHRRLHPEAWLPYMVMANRRLEELGKARLLSPLPTRASLIPCHMCLDTAGLVDLLTDGQDDLRLMQAGAEEWAEQTLLSDEQRRERRQRPSTSAGTQEPAYLLPGLCGGGKREVAPSPSKLRSKTGKKVSTCFKVMLSKCKFNKALKELVAPELQERVAADPEWASTRFKTSLWQALTKLGPGNRHASLEHQGLEFNNMVSTDGYSVSLYYVTPELRGKTQFNGGARAKALARTTQKNARNGAGSTYVSQLSEEERYTLLETEGVVLSADPGKGCLLAVTDGKRCRVRLTAAQRRAESGEPQRAAERRRLLRQRPEGEARTYAQLQRAMGEQGVSRRTCASARYAQYLQARRAVEEQLGALYQRTAFRRQRYDAYLGHKAAEDRFVSRIKNAYGPSIKAILYGDWGANPNLRHQPPTRGVGLRRRLAADFPVYLVHEAYTSSRCPACASSGLTHPRTRDVLDRRDGRRSQREVHHLLRCSGAQCRSRWWNRDVLGSLNILKTGRHCLRHGTWHPLFTAP